MDEKKILAAVAAYQEALRMTERAIEIRDAKKTQLTLAQTDVELYVTKAHELRVALDKLVYGVPESSSGG
jgi:hypothetical protein